jgi:hypothetical protein
MNSFSVQTVISEKTFVRIYLKIVWTSFLIAAYSLLGLYFLYKAFFENWGARGPESTDFYGWFVLGLLTPFLRPINLIFKARRLYKNSPELQHEIEYTFSSDKVTIAYCGGRIDEMDWTEISKTAKVRGYLLLIGSKRQCYIDILGLSGEQLSFIHSSIKSAKSKVGT